MSEVLSAFEEYSAPHFMAERLWPVLEADGWKVLQCWPGRWLASEQAWPEPARPTNHTAIRHVAIDVTPGEGHRWRISGQARFEPGEPYPATASQVQIWAHLDWFTDEQAAALQGALAALGVIPGQPQLDDPVG